MPTLLELYRKDTHLDIDANDSQITIKHGPFGSMTGNQAIVLSELKKPNHTKYVKEAVIQARKDIDDGTEKDVDVKQLAVDWMGIKLGLSVLPHLDITGHLLIQTNPSLVHNTPETVVHAQRLVRLYTRSGVPQRRVCIKIPSTLAGLRAMEILGKEHGIKTLATVVFCVEQSLAAAEAGVIFTSPYVNPLHNHFQPERHVYTDKPMELKGVKVTMEVQRQLRSRKLGMQLVGASLITTEEVVALSGVDRVTMPPGMLDAMEKQEDNAHFQAIRAASIAACSPDYHLPEDVAPDMHYPLAEPATEIKKALARSDIDALIKDALYWFGNAEKELLELAGKTLNEL